jgi:hypothetical protein
MNMATTAAEIDRLADELHDLLDLIDPLRARAGELRLGLAQVGRDYDARLAEVNTEAERLEARIRFLRARLARQPALPEPGAGVIVPPPRIIGDDPPRPGLDPLPGAEARAARKRAVADHIIYFGEAERAAVMQVINAVLADERRDLGDMLELLKWGEIWKARPTWESLDAQKDRLAGWREALRERLTFWRREVARLEGDVSFGLWQRMTRDSRETWLTYLDGLADDQRTANARLAAELAVLDRAWRERQAAHGGTYG